MRIWLSLLALVVLLVACGTQLTWVTPKGQVFQSPVCDYHEPTAGGGPDTCLSREIRATPAEEAKCEADGGFARGSPLVPIVQGINYEACYFPYADIGRACSKATDCRGACDADTRTCRYSEIGGPVLDEDGHVNEGAVE